MPVVSEEQYKIALEISRVAVQYGVPRGELMDLVRLGFEAGQKDGLTALAMNRMGTAQAASA